MRVVVCTRDGCGGCVKLKYGSWAKPSALAGRAVMLDVGLDVAMKGTVSMREYLNAVSALARTAGEVHFVVPDSWDPIKHQNNLANFIDALRRGTFKPTPNAYPIIVAHHMYADEAALTRYLLVANSAVVFGFRKVYIGVPTRRFTAKPGIIIHCSRGEREGRTCRKAVLDTLVYLSKQKLLSPDSVGLHLLGAGTRLIKWVSKLDMGLDVWADTDAYRLAVTKKQRYHKRQGTSGPGLWMVSSQVDPCTWYRQYLGLTEVGGYEGKTGQLGLTTQDLA